MSSPRLRFEQPPDESLVLEPGARREAVLQLIRGARERLILSLFRCDDFKVLDELADAVRRKVRVEALITAKAKGWERRLKDLGAFLESMGASVQRYAGAVPKYHAKYLVADDGPSLIASLNFTLKCFESTCDFVLVTHDPAVSSGLKRLFDVDFRHPESSLPKGLGERLIVGPDCARSRLSGLVREARRSIRIIDHRVTDPEFLALLREKRAEGVAVEVLGYGACGDLVSHGKLILVDDSTAVIGSISLSTPSLDSRREVAVVIRDPGCLALLGEFFGAMAAADGAAVASSPSAELDPDLAED